MGILRLCWAWLFAYRKAIAKCLSLVLSAATLVGVWFAWKQLSASNRANIPVVFPVEINLHHALVGEIDVLEVNWRNGGASRADHVTIDWTWSHKMPQTNDLRRDDFLYHYTVLSHSTIPPGNTLQALQPFPEQESDWINNQKSFYIYGRIRYQDVLARDWHVVMYCSEIQMIEGTRVLGRECQDDRFTCYDSGCAAGQQNGKAN